jgi:hypothetical protein
MDKPAIVILMIEKTKEPYFWALAGTLKAYIYELGSQTVAHLGVKSYSLTDHQFVQVRMDVDGKELIAQIPRRLVGLVLESSGSLSKDAFSFAGGKSK